MKIYQIIAQAYYTDGGLVLCATKTKKLAKAWIRKQYPKCRFNRTEDWYEDDDSLTLLKIKTLEVIEEV